MKAKYLLTLDYRNLFQTVSQVNPRAAHLESLKTKNLKSGWNTTLARLREWSINLEFPALILRSRQMHDETHRVQFQRDHILRQFFKACIEELLEKLPCNFHCSRHFSNSIPLGSRYITGVAWNLPVAMSKGIINTTDNL